MRTRTRLVAVIGPVALGLVWAGCVSLKRSPEARFFVLESVSVEGAAQQRHQVDGIVGVETVRLAGHLDRPQLVTWTGQNELRVDEFLRWAEPLEDGVTRTITENLASLLPQYRVIQKPWPGEVQVRCRVVVSFRSFGLQQDGMVRLEGRMALLPTDEELPLAMERVSLSRGPVASGADGNTVDPGVDEMSNLLMDLSRRIARAITALPPEKEPEESPTDGEPSPEPPEATAGPDGL